MRAILIALLGFALGAFLGVLATLTVIWLWFEVLGRGGDAHKPGLDWLLTLGPVLMLGGGAAMAWWMVRRNRRGQSTTALAVLGAIGFGVLVIYGGGLMGLF